MSTKKTQKTPKFPEQAKNVQYFMGIKGLGIKDVTRACGFDYPNFRNWKAGVHLFPRWAQEKMQNVYGLNPEWILGRSKQMYVAENPEPTPQLRKADVEVFRDLIMGQAKLGEEWITKDMVPALRTLLARALKSKFSAPHKKSSKAHSE